MFQLFPSNHHFLTNQSKVYLKTIPEMTNNTVAPTTAFVNMNSLSQNNLIIFQLLEFIQTYTAFCNFYIHL